jgi:hypothetical protein
MGIGARGMIGWVVEDAPVRALAGEGAGGNGGPRSRSCPQSVQRTLANPCARTPQRR